MNPMPRTSTKAQARRKVFLQRLAIHGNIRLAAEEADATRAWAYDVRSRVPEFARAWDLALDEAADRLEQELHRRAVEGTLRPIYYKGEQVGEVREWSDRLLELALKAARPERYRERVDLNAKVTNVSGDIDAEVARLVEELRSAGANPAEALAEDVPQEP